MSDNTTTVNEEEDTIIYKHIGNFFFDLNVVSISFYAATIVWYLVSIYLNIAVLLNIACIAIEPS